MTRRTPGRVLRATPAALAVALALPLSVSAAQRPTAPTSATLAGASFAFGRAGGNLAPSRIFIARTGRITATGGMKHAGAVSTDAVNGLLKLARAERFFTMARATTCLADNPDFAGNYVTVTTPSQARTVSVRGSCRPSFTQLYEVLAAVAGVE